MRCTKRMHSGTHLGPSKLKVCGYGADALDVEQKVHDGILDAE
jgi:hypothetical protein